jgi:uncharacterized repeat protein (TIGR04052 family)
MTINKPLLASIHSIYFSYPKILLLLGVFFIVACSDWAKKEPLSTIKVELWYEQQALACRQSLERETLDWSIEQFAFFISDISLMQAGNKQRLKLRTNDWQSEDVALVRFTDSQCATEKSPAVESNHLEVVELPFQTLQLVEPTELADDSELSFTLGLPFALNHLNPLSQPSPLNMPSMFWSWRGGHKFLRLDMISERQSWTFHLGSTGCTSASAMRSPQAECINPNTVQITLAKQRQGDRLIVHLDKLLLGIEIDLKSSCLMQPDRASCQLLLANLANNEVFEWR